MQELLLRNPWLIIVVLGLLIPITAIVFGTVTRYLQNTRLAELDAALKQDMLQRGMSAEEIVQVLEASSTKKSKRCDSSQEFRKDAAANRT